MLQIKLVIFFHLTLRGKLNKQIQFNKMECLNLTRATKIPTHEVSLKDFIYLLLFLAPFYHWKKNTNLASIPFAPPITMNRKFLLTRCQVRKIRWLWPESFHVLSIIMKYNATSISTNNALEVEFPRTICKISTCTRSIHQI